jgi:AcrR family transcriptional regulator
VLRQGLELLAEGGIDALTIEALCARLKVTKGSFYHHFSGRDAFLRALLEHWAAGAVAPGRARNPRRRLDALLPVPGGPEAAIRAWAMRDPEVGAYQRRVDARRLETLETLLRETTGDSARAALLARMGCALLAGAEALAPPLGPAQRAAMLDVLWTELCMAPGERRGKEDS